MAQVTIYLPDDIEREARKAAKAAKVSVSKWVADQVTRSVAESWPADVLALAGAFEDFPEVDQLRSGYGADTARESFD